MVTGDLKETAQSIGMQLGLLRTQEPDKFCFSGRELEEMNSQEQGALIDEFIKNSYSLIFYRLEPKHKRVLVSILSKKVIYISHIYRYIIFMYINILISYI